jgi:hypothetical protein
MDIADVLRWLAILQGMFVVGMSAMIIPYYLNDWRFMHVTLTATSYLLLSVSSLITLATHWGDVPSWKLAVNLTAYVLGNWGLLHLLNLKRAQNLNIVATNRDAAA